MKLCFMILAHKYPGQVILLVQQLRVYPNAHVVIHVDAKSRGMHEELKQRFTDDPKISFIEKRFPVSWGSFNQIRATLSLFRNANELKPDYALLLSGQDLATQPVSALIGFLEQNAGRQYVSSFSLPEPSWSEGGLDRLQYFHFDSHYFPLLSRRVNACALRIQKMLGLKRKLDLVFYGGSNWINVSGPALDYIVNFVSRNPRIMRRFRFTRCADEIFVQTILMNSEFASTVVNNDLRFVDWSTGPEFPRTLRMADYERIIDDRSKFFARKFDVNTDRQIIEKLVCQ